MELVNEGPAEQLHWRQLCTLVALNVANVFNSVWWDKIEKSLIQRGVSNYLMQIMRGYLFDRELIIGEDNIEKLPARFHGSRSLESSCGISCTTDSWE